MPRAPRTSHTKNQSSHRSKKIFVRSQFITTPGRIPFLSESCSERVFRKWCVSRLHPYALKTSGVNEACSTCIHRCMILLAFLLSFISCKSSIQILVQMCLGVRIKNPNIKECHSTSFPEPSCSYI